MIVHIRTGEIESTRILRELIEKEIKQRLELLSDRVGVVLVWVGTNETGNCAFKFFCRIHADFIPSTAVKAEAVNEDLEIAIRTASVRIASRVKLELDFTNELEAKNWR